MRAWGIVGLLFLLAVLMWLLLNGTASTRRGRGTGAAEVRQPTGEPHVGDNEVEGPQPSGLPATGGAVLTGTVKTIEGAPVAGATVRASVGEGLETTTGSDGTYVLKDAVRGSYPVEAVAQGYARAARQVTVNASEVRVDFVLHADGPLFGRVVDQDGRPVAAAQLWAMPESGPGASLPPRVADIEGHFRFDDAYEGRWWLHVYGPRDGGWSGGRAILVSSAESPLDVRLIRRPPGGTELVVDVVDAATDRPAEVTDVTLQRFGEMEPVSVESSLGRIAARGLVPGLWRLEFGTDIVRMGADIAIRPDITIERRRIAVALGAISGHAEVVETPSRPETQTLTTKPAHVGVGATPSKQEARPFTLGFALLERETGYAFRLDQLPLDMPFLLVVEGKDLFGLLRVCASPGAEAPAVVPVLPAGRVVLRIDRDLPVRPIRVDFRPVPGEEWLDAAEAENAFHAWLPAGKARWLVRYPDFHTGEPVTHEGAADIVAGRTTEIEPDLASADGG